MVCAKIVKKLLAKINLILHKAIEARDSKYKKEKIMEKYVCTVCHYVYDPAENDNVAFEDLPDDYTCPLCGVGKDMFERE